MASHLTKNKMQSSYQGQQVPIWLVLPLPSNFISSSSCLLCDSWNSLLVVYWTCQAHYQPLSSMMILFRLLFHLEGSPLLSKGHNPGDHHLLQDPHGSLRLPPCSLFLVFPCKKYIDAFLIFQCIFLFILYLLLLYIWRREVCLLGDIKNKSPKPVSFLLSSLLLVLIFFFATFSLLDNV